MPSMIPDLIVITHYRDPYFPHSFLFYSPGAHRHLHSFPTRRSSDLLHEETSVVPENLGLDDQRIVDGSTDRSEEHTSELQSRENLVCRLLLEKKNRRQRYTNKDKDLTSYVGESMICMIANMWTGMTE